MMADCATVGGYPKIATAITADLPLMAQARTGDVVRFERCDLDAALDALRQREARLAGMEASLREELPCPRST
jgi:allophanate hydrolase subunit 2